MGEFCLGTEQRGCGSGFRQKMGTRKQNWEPSREKGGLKYWQWGDQVHRGKGHRCKTLSLFLRCLEKRRQERYSEGMVKQFKNLGVTEAQGQVPNCGFAEWENNDPLPFDPLCLICGIEEKAWTLVRKWFCCLFHLPHDWAVICLPLKRENHNFLWFKCSQFFKGT